VPGGQYFESQLAGMEREREAAEREQGQRSRDGNAAEA